MIQYFTIGFVAALLGSMSGLGGGFIIVPALYYLGVPVQYVVGTSKFTVFATSIISTYRYFKKLKIPIRLYVSIVIPMTLMAYLGAYLVTTLPVDILTLIIGSVLLVACIGMLKSTQDSSSHGELELVKSRIYILGIFLGGIAGFVSGISGLGGGVVNVPAFIYILRLEPRLAVSLSIASIFPSALSSVVRHVVDNVINWNIAISISIGAIMGGWVGPSIALKMKRETLRKTIALIIAAATMRMMLEALMKLLSM